MNSLKNVLHFIGFPGIDDILAIESLWLTPLKLLIGAILLIYTIMMGMWELARSVEGN